MTQLATLLTRLRRTGEKVQLDQLTAVLERDKYTGPVVLHFKHGVALRAVPLDREEGIDLTKGAQEST